MTESKDPLIHIIPQFKELSKGLMVKINKKCGRGATNENCIADYKDGKLIKRQNYNKIVDENEQLPNRFLGTNFRIKQANGLEIGNYLQNWDILFQTINGIIPQPQGQGQGPRPPGQGQGQQPPGQGQGPQPPGQGPHPGFFDRLSEKVSNFAETTKKAAATAYDSVNSPPKKNVFITSHQHNLQHMFFNFEKLEASKYGFRNCTCIKISKNKDQITMQVIHSEDTGRDKKDYTYLKKNEFIHIENTNIDEEKNKVAQTKLNLKHFMILAKY